MVSRQREEQKRHPERLAARQAVHDAVKAGRLPSPLTLACVDCGGTAREYDHHISYEVEHRLSVEPVCVPCHAIRSKTRARALPPKITAVAPVLPLPAMEERDVIPLGEAAVQAGCSERKVYALIAAGTVEPRKVRGDRRTYVSLSEVKTALAALPPARRRPRRWRAGEGQ